MNFAYCPRCGEQSYEHLKSYSYCAGCNYSPTLDEQYEPAIPEWALKACYGDDPIAFEDLKKEKFYE